MFSLDKLKEFDDYKARIHFVNDNLTLLGKGSSRVVYRYDKFKVIKIAKNYKGLKQNEIETYYKYKKFNYITNVLDFDNDTTTNEILWILTEYAIPLKTQEELYNLLGIIEPQFKNLIYYLDKIIINKNNIETSEGRTPNTSILLKTKELMNEKNPNLFEEIVEMTEKFSLTDIFYYDNWGYLTRKNKITPVILDLGMNYEVFKNHY